MTVRGLERSVSNQLLAWSGLSILAGMGFLLGGPFWRGLGVQFVIWGAVDAAIALVGRWRASKPSSSDEVRLRNLRRALLINAGLDVLYVLIGVAVLLFTEGAFAVGNGWGVIVQGGFLLLFDTWHGLVSVRRVVN